VSLVTDGKIYNLTNALLWSQARLASMSASYFLFLTRNHEPCDAVTVLCIRSIYVFIDHLQPKLPMGESFLAVPHAGTRLTIDRLLHHMEYSVV
jgi:hypothetical protein